MQKFGIRKDQVRLSLHAKTNLKVTIKLNAIICPDKVVEEIGQIVVQHCKCTYQGEDNNAEIFLKTQRARGLMT